MSGARSSNVPPYRPARVTPWPSIDGAIRRMGWDDRHDPEPVPWQPPITPVEFAAAIELARRDPRRKLPGWRNPAVVVLDGLLRDARDRGPIGRVARAAVRQLIRPVPERDHQDDDDDEESVAS